MARSVSLAAYLALARRAPPADWTPPSVPRPRGPLVWAHAGSAEGLPALMQVACRLDAAETGAHMLVTGGEGAVCPSRLPPGVLWHDVPPENIDADEAFLRHWAPDVGLWSTGHLRPALLTCAGRANVPLILVDGTEAALDDKRARWLPDVSGRVINQFRHAFAQSANAARRLQRLGMPPDRIDVSGPLQQGGQALSCDDDERTAMAAAIGGRSVWLAAMIQRDELEQVLEAHRQASRSIHRLLLILVPDRVEDGPAFAEVVHGAGWRVARWSDGEHPTEATQVLLADTFGDMGLWYRLSPISFMGSSLTAGHGGSDPYEPAALGSAILYGPNMGRYLPGYRRLAEAGAARIVRDPATLSAAVSRLTAPDQAATMAHAAWSVATEGAEATDRVVDMVQDILDRRSTR
ncbi:hypothetical protein ATO6_02150 [Oceanicola sp. 22II-s10i]|uniref:3-deoxy-D-manno-octulosonic acid transferase n=1 Tax=Oceanicola sp. 22II-s10i TaxID=1317116 RepID=UPI000B525032|nr:glycosyltransferase N-terminal domain-containing protein [Oceanicola sp. 22II-s10i]OWU85740.1 hypothetical protein ATO6_02150 [Oceanicola sp. 22II-s10i]